MQRGVQKLFNDFIDDKPVLTAVKGRSATLIDARNRLLLHRYYWHQRREIEPGVHMTYKSILRTIKNELFIEERTIVNILDECYRDFQMLRRQYKQHSDADLSRTLKKQWPWLVW